MVTPLLFFYLLNELLKHHRPFDQKVYFIPSRFPACPTLTQVLQEHLIFPNHQRIPDTKLTKLETQLSRTAVSFACHKVTLLKSSLVHSTGQKPSIHPRRSLLVLPLVVYIFSPSHCSLRHSHWPRLVGSWGTSKISHILFWNQFHYQFLSPCYELATWALTLFLQDNFISGSCSFPCH